MPNPSMAAGEPPVDSTEAAPPPAQRDLADGLLDVVHVMVDGILVVDQSGEVRFANPAAADVLGRQPNDLRELPFGLPLTGGAGLAQLDVARPDGSQVVLEMHAAPLRWRGEDVQVVTLRDITARVSAERRLARSEERYALSARGANDGLWDWDRDSGRVHTSARLQEMLGHRPRDQAMDPQRLLDRVHPEDVAGVRRELDRHLSGTTNGFRHEFRLRRRDGSWLWVMARGMAVAERGQVRRFAGSLTDVSDRKQAEDSLRRLALHDSLTGLANRALFLDHLQGAIERRRRSGTPFAVLFFDLDRFKLVNDSLGHAAGDALLVEVGRRLERCVRGTDTVARLGGDEFAVLLDAPESNDTVTATVERIRQAIAVPVHLGPRVLYTTASIGVARSDEIPPDPETALRHADIAMYEAKSAGPNNFRVFAAAMQAQASARLELHSDLRQAVRQRLLFPRYQPIVDLDDGRIVGFEALLRWRLPSGAVLDAAAFIDAAEEINVLAALSRDVLFRASRQLQEWHSLGFPVEMTVNVCERQVLEENLYDEIAGLLNELDLDGRSLGIEITERTAMVEAEGALTQLARLRTLGLGILVDDFGTGYSSLTAIRHLPLTAVKIDKAFVSGLERDATDDIIPAIIAIARSLQLRVVAEGIETPAQRDRLRALGCERGQGFLFGHAVDASRATRLLRAQEEQPTARRPPRQRAPRP